MADFDDFEDLKENRFAHLLKPIRDLQDNFNIDLARELEEYLDQLENAQFAFEGARQGMVDFAEAALLIQGSTCVYSKKVEYLYNLVYQALEAVKGKKRQQALGPDGQPLDGDAGPAQAGARGRGAAVARAGEDDEDDGLEHFWDVEPLLKQSADIDLSPGDGLMPNAGNSTRPPAALLALEDHGQSAASSADSKGDGDAGVYRLQQCVVHCSGALLLDPRDGDMYDYELRFIGPQPRHDRSLEMMLNDHQMAQPIQLAPMPAMQASVPAQAQQAPNPNGEAADAPMEAAQADQAADDYYDDDGGGGGGGGDWPSDDEGVAAAADVAGGKDFGMDVDGLSVGGDGSARTIPAAAGPLHQPQATSTAAGAASDAFQQGGGNADAEGAEEEVYDPYKPLDPAAKGRLPDRPLVVRKPRKTRRNPTATGRPRDAAGAAAGGLLLPEFSYCLEFLRPTSRAAEEPQARPQGRATGCKARPARVALAGAAIAGPVFDARDAAAAVAADEAAAADPAEAAQADEPHGAQQYGFDDDDDGGGGYGGGGGASDLDDDVDPALGGDGFGAAPWHQPDDAEAAGRMREGLWPGGVPPMGQLGGPEDGMAVDGMEPSYEELCRAHMESMLMAAAAREVQSDLARRVSSWRQRIDPVLHAEESRAAFDIQDYGERILGRLSDLKISDAEHQPEAQQQGAAGEEARPVRVNFGLVAKDLQKFEVSRMFSAMLQLINNRNVALYRNDCAGVAPGEVPDEPFALQLLSTDMYHKTMGENLAVSGLNQQAGGAASPGDEDEDVENSATQRARAKQGAGAGRGKAGGGGAKRAKKAHAPLADANADD